MSLDTSQLLPLLIVVLVTVVLLATGASIGYWAGLQIAAGRDSSAGDDQESSELWRYERTMLLRAIDRCLEDGLRTAQESEQVAELAQQHLPAVAGDLGQAIERLTTTTRSLTRQLEEVRAARYTPTRIPTPVQTADVHTLPADPQRQTDQEHDHAPSAHEPLADDPRAFPVADAAAAGSQLTSAEIRTVVGASQRAATPLQIDHEVQRFAYDCQQQMAPWHLGDHVPDASQFISVRCHDISATGLSFFFPDKPDFEAVVISIGSGETRIFMAAQVQQHKAVYMHQEVLYLVGCRFVRRLDDLARRWQQIRANESTNRLHPVGAA